MDKWNVRASAWNQLSYEIANHNDIYIYGLSCNGKTTLARDCLSANHIPYSYISCKEACTFPELLENIIDEYIKGFLMIDLTRSGNPLKIAMEMQNASNKDSIYYVILDKIDSIVKCSILAIHKLVELRDLACCNLKLILISEIYEDSLFIHPDSIDRSLHPSMIFLQDYNENQLKIILRKEFSYGTDNDFAEFISIIYHLLFPFSSKIFLLRHACIKYYSSYLDKSNEYGNAQNKHDKLFTFIQREIGDVEEFLFEKKVSYRDFQYGLTNEAKLLLISGYICSHNPEKYDKYVIKAVRKNVKKKNTKDIENFTLKQPEIFPLERLLSVYSVLYHVILSSKTKQIIQVNAETPSFCSLVNILIQKHFFQRVQRNDPIGSERFICNADLEFIKELSKSMRIKLHEYVLGLSQN
ncbi:unnamed protein product [Blepharisma stoltei]|uniref:Origin recognition complex subunit 5 C-terminal domain-containing protein n=1 Tax=Blepharisma stoltei TaxID=1481888 RepID=A0AAU9KEL4_9CILI|nr:unnamed protein product [Blepharisma stoltei]